MSKDYGVWCMNCKQGYLTDEHSNRLLADLVAVRGRVARALEAVCALNARPGVLITLTCDELSMHDNEHVLGFIAEHCNHDLQVLDEYQFHDLGWVGNAR